ncbi:MAG: FAD-binding oxidoreductase [Solirubrobacteraceae bacterium]
MAVAELSTQTAFEATGTGVQTRPSDQALEELRAAIRGDLLVPEDPGYAQVRPAFNAMYPGRPAVVVRATGTADVVDAVQFARQHGLLVAVRGGGHSVAGLSSVDGGLLIDLAVMNGVIVDRDARIARVQGGALWGDVDRETQRFGLVAPGGVVSDTGVAGLTLGGGQGWVRRKHGLSCDNVLSAQVVCADGEARTASADTNPDLYWAIRGGGGNFGIVTSFSFQLHPLDPIVAFAGVFYPAAEAAHVIRGFRDYMSTAPDEVSAQTVSFTMPADEDLPAEVHNKACTIVAGVYAGDPDEGMQVLRPLRELAPPLADISQPMPFTDVQRGFDPLFVRGTLRGYLKSQYLAQLSNEAIDLVAQQIRQRATPRTLIATLPMGAAINRVGSQETAYAERSALWMVSIDGFWSDAAGDATAIAWVRQACTDLGKYGTGTPYLNFTSIADENPSVGVERAFGQNLQRLAHIKAKYDPDNFFRLNNNIPPAARPAHERANG